jgi:hypothetical protein
MRGGVTRVLASTTPMLANPRGNPLSIRDRAAPEKMAHSAVPAVPVRPPPGRRAGCTAVAPMHTIIVQACTKTADKSNDLKL